MQGCGSSQVKFGCSVVAESGVTPVLAGMERDRIWAQQCCEVEVFVHDLDTSPFGSVGEAVKQGSCCCPVSELSHCVCVGLNVERLPAQPVLYSAATPG